MKLKRISTQETVSLSDGFLWSDEFDWNSIEQKQDRAVDGALIIQEGKKKSGRPITLTADKNMFLLRKVSVFYLKKLRKQIMKGHSFLRWVIYELK